MTNSVFFSPASGWSGALPTSILIACVSVLGCADGGGIDAASETTECAVETPAIPEALAKNSCTQTAFPADEPDLHLLMPPRFLPTAASDEKSGQVAVRSGDRAEFEAWVNSATRRVIVELVSGDGSETVAASSEQTTEGDETVRFALLPSVVRPGRFYARLTLCTQDCDALQVLFDPSPEGAWYQRTVIRGGDAVRTDATCFSLLERSPGAGSSSILIRCPDE